MSEIEDGDNQIAQINTTGAFIGQDANAGRDVAGRDIITNNYYLNLPTYQTSSSSPKIDFVLPLKTYHHFIGRSSESNEIMNGLREPTRKLIIAIVGLGGIGKTALALEIAERCRQENLFDYVVWSTSKTEDFVGEKIKRREDISFDFNSLLSDIARQCHRVDIASMPYENKRVAVEQVLASNRVLIFIDNLETIPNREEIIYNVFGILGRGKLLVTSRWQVQHERVFTIKLSGLPEEESYIFLREEGRERNVISVAQAEIGALSEIYHSTGGAPLAMKLVVGQMSRQPMAIVLNMLKTAAANGQNEDFYRFVYWYSWNLLNENSRMVLVDMSVFSPIIGGAVDDVEKLSQLPANIFWQAMDQLVVMSLVDKTGIAGKERLALHTLTHNFILSDITKEWS